MSYPLVYKFLPPPPPSSLSYLICFCSQTVFNNQMYLIVCSFVEEVVGSRDAQEYALSMELASVGTSTILALKVSNDTVARI